MNIRIATRTALAALLASAGTLAYAQTGGGGAMQQPGGGPQGGERSLQQAPRGGAGGGGQQPSTRQGIERRPGETGPMRQEQLQRGEQPPSMRKGEQRGEQQPRAREGREQAKEKATGEDRQRGAGGGVGVRPELSQEQRSTIRQRLSGGPRVSDLGGASISVGTRLPREVEIRPLPAAVIEIVPQYRGYHYVLVGEQIVIVDPDTLEIVAVLAA